jgi:ParB family chromosome partitioning protein
MSSKAAKLGAGASFASTAGGVSARRAAIAAATGAPTSGVVPHELPISAISHNPDNPRDTLPGIEEMADTFDSVGQVTAITVATRLAYLEQRPDRVGELDSDTEYVVVDGHRRLAAARLLGWDTIRVMVYDAQVSSDERLLEAAFVANTQRDNMTDLEQAAALSKLVEFYGSQGKAAKRLGMTQANISQRLSLLSLSPELQADLNAGVRQVKHVRGLANFSPEQQKAKADERAATSGQKASVPRPAAGLPAHGPAPHNPVMSPEEQQAPPAQQPVVPSPAREQAAAPPDGLPALDWNNPESIAAHVIHHLEPKRRRRVTALLLQSMPEV